MQHNSLHQSPLIKVSIGIFPFCYRISKRSPDKRVDVNSLYTSQGEYSHTSFLFTHIAPQFLQKITSEKQFVSGCYHYF